MPRARPAWPREFGQDPDDVAVFLRHYFRHVDAMDVDERRVEDLLGLVASHYRAALHRPAARAVISIRTPSQRDDGWTAGGATVVQIVTDDRPFLVDSVTMEVLRQGWSIREVFHPQFLVRRDLDGELRGIVRSTEAAARPRRDCPSPGCTWRSCRPRGRTAPTRWSPTWSRACSRCSGWSRRPSRTGRR